MKYAIRGKEFFPVFALSFVVNTNGFYVGAGRNFHKIIEENSLFR